MTNRDEPLKVMDLETVDETAPLPQTKDPAKNRSVFDRLSYGGPARGPRRTNDEQSDTGGKNVDSGKSEATNRAGKGPGRQAASKAGQTKARPAAAASSTVTATNNANTPSATADGTMTPSSGTGSVFDRLTSGEKLYRNSSQTGKKGGGGKKVDPDPVSSSSKQRQPSGSKRAAESVQQQVESPTGPPASETNNGVSPDREELVMDDDEDEDPVINVSLVQPPAKVRSARRKKSARSQQEPPPKRREPWKIARIPLSLVERTSLARGALPVLPQPMAWACLLFNGLLPGTGTMLSGVLGMCFGAPRFSVHVTAEHRFLALVINLLVGIFQTVTVLFCLVGWCWSLGWGILLVKVAGYYVKWKKTSLNNPDEDRHMMMNVAPVSMTGDEESFTIAFPASVAPLTLRSLTSQTCCMLTRTGAAPPWKR